VSTQAEIAQKRLEIEHARFNITQNRETREFLRRIQAKADELNTCIRNRESAQKLDKEELEQMLKGLHDGANAVAALVDPDLEALQAELVTLRQRLVTECNEAEGDCEQQVPGDD